MHDRDARACVFKIVAIIIGRQQGVHHRYHCAYAGRAEPGPDKLGTIRKYDQHPIFHFDSELAQGIAHAIRHRRHFRIRIGLVLEVETGLVLTAFLQIVI